MVYFKTNNCKANEKEDKMWWVGELIQVTDTTCGLENVQNIYVRYIIIMREYLIIIYRSWVGRTIPRLNNKWMLSIRNSYFIQEN